MYLLLLIQRYGAWRGGLLYFRLNILKTSSIRLPDFKNPIHLRRDVQDVHAFAQVFLHREYDFDWPSDVRRIVDGGANVGFASLYFKGQFPEAQIHAVEPHPHNAEAFRKNTAYLEGITLSQKAIHHSDHVHLRLTDEGFGSNGFMTRDEASGSAVADVETLSIGGIQKAMGWEAIDLVKLDIEGGEEALFQANLEWMECTRFIVLEFHERMVPSSSKPALRALADKGFAVLDVRGENVLFGRPSQG